MAIVLLAALGGCATPEPPKNFGANPGDPRLILKSTNMPMNVDYSISAGEKPCDDFEKVGTVRDSGRGVLLPWIANMSETFNKTPTKLETTIPGGKDIQVKAYGNWFDSTSKGFCGPIVTKFPANASRTYLVEFVWAGTSACSVRVSDITDPTSAKSVAATAHDCPRPLFGL
jgi:hypothetical protein